MDALQAQGKVKVTHVEDYEGQYSYIKVEATMEVEAT